MKLKSLAESQEVNTVVQAWKFSRETVWISPNGSISNSMTWFGTMTNQNQTRPRNHANWDDERYSANVITKNLYARVDDDGHMEAMLKEISGHKKGPNAIDKEEGFTRSHNGNQIPIRTTKGWEIEVH